MIRRSKTKKMLFAAFAAVIFGALGWTAPAEAQWGPRYGDWASGWRGWGGYHWMDVGLDDRDLFRPRYFRRPTFDEYPRFVRRPVVRETMIVERRIVRRPVVIHHTVIVKRPVHVGRYVRRPIYERHAWYERRWHERRRCFLPERYLCR